MLIDGALHQSCLACRLINGGKEFGLLIMMMLSNTIMPGETITNKVFLIHNLYAWGLLVDAVETSNEGIMA